ncbi:YifB family Mg chelatase-like AAA ATPase [bacterium]|nr:YifB family Mg chelatase-like AAA ATPase [bacterium]
MYFKLHSGTLNGIGGEIITIEVDLSRGLPTFSIVGLPDTAIRESKERIRSSLINNGYKFPMKHTAINLSPADLKKKGSYLDLPIAVALLCATEQVISRMEEPILMIGGLNLDGSVQQNRGILPIMVAAKAAGFKKIIIPSQNYIEAGYIEDVEIIPVNNIVEAVRVIEGDSEIDTVKFNTSWDETDAEDEICIDYEDIFGHESAKRAVELAVAGAHNILLIGPPGSGKSLMASAIPSILPALNKEERLESAIIFSSRGIDNSSIMKGIPAFRAPHHSASSSGLFGGGTNPVPGEISLANNGVLFLDELPEFPRGLIEKLRQPISEKNITVIRNGASYCFPAKFMLVTAANPCPCGYYGDDKKECQCSDNQIRNYRRKFSGPILDRIDIRIQVNRVSPEHLVFCKKGENSKSIKKRVTAARKKQIERYEDYSFKNNSEVPPGLIDKLFILTAKHRNFLVEIMKRHDFSGRSYHSILKIARTIADLDNSENIEIDHIIESVAYRFI